MAETKAEEWKNVEVSTVKEPRTYEAKLLLKYVWVIKLERFLLLEDLEQAWTVNQFNETFSHLPLPDDMKPNDYIREANKEHRVVDHMQMAPNESFIFTNKYGHKVLNFWKPNATPPTEITESPKLFLDHLDYIFEGNKENVQHVLRWMAHILFLPEYRMRHGICLSGQIQGTGKSTIASVMKALIGDGGTQVQPDHLTQNFNSWILGTRLAVVEEVNSLGQHRLYNKVKTYFSENRLSVEAKFKSVIQYDNFCNFLFFSNYFYPIALEASDRRLFYVHTNVKPKEPEYYHQLHAYLDLEATESRDGTMGGAWAFYKYLKDEVLPTIPKNFATTPPPKTADKEEMVAAAIHPLIDYVNEERAEGRGLFAKRTFFKWSTLKEHLYMSFPDKHILKNNQATIGTLRQAHLHRTKPRVIAGQKETIVCWFDDDKEFDSELKELFADTSKTARNKLYSYYYDFNERSYDFEAPDRSDNGGFSTEDDDDDIPLAS